MRTILPEEMLQRMNALFQNLDSQRKWVAVGFRLTGICICLIADSWLQADELFSNRSDAPVVQPTAATQFRRSVEVTRQNNLQNEPGVFELQVASDGVSDSSLAVDSSSWSDQESIWPESESAGGYSDVNDTSSSDSMKLQREEEDGDFCTSASEWPLQKEPQTDDCAPVSRFRNGFLQGIQFSTGTVGTGGSDTLSVQHVQTAVSVAVPLGNEEKITDNVLMISPGIRADMLDAPVALDLPDTLFEPSLQFFWRRVFNDRLSSSVIFAPALRTDFETSENAFRIFGLATLNWEAIPDKLWLSGGAVYLDRADYTALPAAGLTWMPVPVLKLDIQFPQPRVSYRLNKDGANSESWLYLAGGFGGNTWAVTRNNGQADELTLSELRMVTGYERLLAGNRGGFGEVGWAFNRSAEYLKTPLEMDFQDTFVARIGITF